MKNKILGSALMIAGTTIGAGMLAMPLTSAGMGFGMTLVLLVGLWLLLTYTGLLFMEVYQTAKQQDVGVATLAEQYFGMTGRVLATASLLILLYALLAAYITGGGSLVSGVLPENLGADNALKLGILIFTFILGTFVVIGIKGVDGLTRILFIGKIVAFIGVLMMMLPKAKLENLTSVPLDNLLVISAIPIFFTSFGFHVIMGSINSYLEADIKKIRIAVLIGTIIPLSAYLLWQLATHGVLSQNEFATLLKQDATLNGLVKATSQITGNTVLGEMVRIFSTLALITSFLGVAMGIFEGVGDLLKRVQLPNNRLILTPLNLYSTAFVCIVLSKWFYHSIRLCRFTLCFLRISASNRLGMACSSIAPKSVIPCCGRECCFSDCVDYGRDYYGHSILNASWNFTVCCRLIM